MKFFFAKTDSLYKIFKTLEKIPTGRAVEIFIDPEHAVFENEWRGKQIKDLIDTKKLDTRFTTKNKANREYFQKIWLKTNHIQQRNIEKLGNYFYLFFFNIKNFHLHAYESKKYLFAIIFLLEALFIGIVLRVVISLIIPSANLKIHPTEETNTMIYNFRYYPHTNSGFLQESRYLSIPYYTGTLTYKYDLTISTANIRHITNPSQGQIKLYNKSEKSYSFLGWTRFITDGGVVFRSIGEFAIGTGSEDNRAEVIITVQAEEKDEQGNIIGVRGNIAKNTQLLIRNLNESYYLKELWAEAIQDFQGWRSESVGRVTDTDIETLSEKLTTQVYKEKMNIIAQNFQVPEAILLPFDAITTTTFHRTETEQLSWDDSPTIKGSAYVSYDYKYIYRSDILNAFTTYIKERPSDKIEVLSIDKNSIKFVQSSNSFEATNLSAGNGTFIIPTQIDSIQGYDFDQDTNNILSDIKNTIAGKSIDESRKYILSSFPEIWSINISISPFWSRNIPSIKSRIKISTNNQ